MEKISSKHGEVLILCTGNSCRSQMAEGLINYYLADTWQAYSAGTVPAGAVHPLAVTVLSERGIDIANNTSKSTEQFRDKVFDWVITVCDDAAENCPVWLGQGNTVHFGFPDPAQAVGTEEEIMAVLRKVRDDIYTDVLGFLRNASD